MRSRAIWTGAATLLALAVFAGSAAAAAPRWPSAADIQAKEPGIASDDAACMAGFFTGRLARAEWLAAYYSLTPARKRIASAGLTRCMTQQERIAMRERDFSRVLGKHAELRCVAERLDARSWAVRLAVTTRLDELRMYDRVFRACGLMGVLYDEFGHRMQLVLSVKERRCANRFGSVLALMPDGQAYTNVERDAIGAVFDRCVGTRTEGAMWRRLARLKDSANVAACVSRRMTNATTFALLFTREPAATRLAERALSSCRQRAATRTGAGARRSVSAAGPA